MTKKKEVEGGCILLARQTLLSEIWQKPPAYFKIFFYILAKVNHTNNKSFPRGTGLFNFRQITIPGVTRYQIYEFLRWAKSLNPTDSTTLITTQKTTRGIIIKVNNYNIFQDWNTYYPQHRKQHENQQPPNTISINNKDIYSNNNISLSSSKEKNTKIEISDDERDFLKNYARKNGAKYVNPYVRKLIANGDADDILKKYRSTKQKKAETTAAEKIEEIQEDEETKKAAYEEFKKAAEELKKVRGIK